MSKDKQPEIRFPGFTEDWEQRKLGELYETYSGMTPLRSDLSNFENPDTPWIKTTDLRNNAITFNEEKISNKASKKLKLLPKGTVLIAMYGGFNQIGRTGILTYPATINQALTALQPLKEITPYFLLTELNYRVNDWKRLAASSRKDPNITKKDVENFNFYFPKLDEQIEIGSFFKSLDSTIVLYQRKLDLLKETKKGFLQKMFPKNGAKVPEIRFPGFTEDWEERKLGEFLIVPQNIKADVRSTDDLMTVKLNLGGVSSGSNRETLSLGSTAYYERRAGQFIYGKQNFFNGSMAIIPEELDGKATSGDVPALNIININTQYLYVYISRTEYWRRKEAAASGTGSKRIHESVLQGFEIDVPTDKEQQKIGTFFKQLDDTITLHQRKLDLLKETKKGFLQKMFV